MNAALSKSSGTTVVARLLRVASRVIRDPADLRPDDVLVGGRLSLDSLKLVELFAAVEREFEVTIADEQVIEFIGLRFAEIAGVLEERMAARQAHV